MAGAHFGSDNVSGIAPEILATISAANRGGVDSYGGDALSAGLEARFSRLFETEVSVLPVGTGTIANCLALALATPPWGAVFCSQEAHIVVDEANGPEFFTGGAKLTTIPTADGRLSVEDGGQIAGDVGSINTPPPVMKSQEKPAEKPAATPDAPPQKAPAEAQAG